MKDRILLFTILILLLVIIYQALIIFNAKDIKYSANDMYRIRDIILENTVATDLDYKVYDLNNDSVLDVLDMMIIKRHFLDIEKIPNVKIIKGR